MERMQTNFGGVISELVARLEKLDENKISEDIKDIIRKLADTVRLSSLLDTGRERDFIDFEKFPRILGSEHLPQLINGIRNQKVLEIYYQPFYEDKPYFIRVHPYLLKEYNSRWYLIGLNDLKKEIRTYGLDRVWEIKEIDIPYIAKNFNSREYFKNTVGIISPAGDPPRIKVEVLKPQAQYLITQPLHPSQSIESESEQNIVFTYRVHPTYEFKMLLLGLGSDIKVVEPASLRQEIIRELKTALDSYDL